jgi:uncharacterized membrane protein
MSNDNIEIVPKVDAKIDAKVDARSASARPASARRTQDFVTAAATVGVIAAGVVLLEVALIPGMLIGGAAVLAPRYLPKYLPKLQRRLRPLFEPASPRRIEPGVALPGRLNVKGLLATLTGSTVKRAIAKTITFRIIVTSLDFTVNYIVIGELATAAGLSAFALVVGPVFYLVHETAWNHFAGSNDRVGLGFIRPRPDTEDRPPARGGFTISRALAKTITFRTIATTVDFTTTFVVVGDFATAVALSASGFVLGPFVYLGHEMAWDHYDPPMARAPEAAAPMKLLPAPG